MTHTAAEFLSRHRQLGGRLQRNARRLTFLQQRSQMQNGPWKVLHRSMARWFMRHTITIHCAVYSCVAWRDALKVLKFHQLYLCQPTLIDKKANYKSLTLAESLEEQSADKSIMLMWQSGWSNFKQIALVGQQQDACCSLDQPRCFHASLSGKLANKPQRISKSERMSLERPQVSLHISTADHWRLLGGLSHVGRSLLHKDRVCLICSSAV